MTPPTTPLSIVQKWKKRCEDFDQAEDDGMVTTIHEGVKAMEIILEKHSSNKDIARALAYLDCERILSLKHDTVRNETLDLVYGLGECLHLTLNEMTKDKMKPAGTLATKEITQTVRKHSISSNEDSDPIFTIKQENHSILNDLSKERNTVNEARILGMQEPNQPVLRPAITSIDHSYAFTPNKQEGIKPVILIGDCYPVMGRLNSRNELGVDTNGNTFSEIGNDGQRDAGSPLIKNEPVETMDYGYDNLEGGYDRERCGGSPLIKNEPIETMDYAYDNLEIGNYGPRLVGFPLIKNEPVETMDYGYDNLEDSSETVYETNLKLSLKKKRVSFGGFDESESEMKKPRIVQKHFARDNGELKCPECAYCTFTVDRWLGHLRSQHSTNPAQAGVALLCDCGVESVSVGQSVTHSRECDIAKFVVIRTSHSKCVQCEAYPTTACGYVQHMRTYHRSTLKEIGIYLMCSCGLIVRGQFRNPEHTKRCNGRQFTIHKIDAN